MNDKILSLLGIIVNRLTILSPDIIIVGQGIIGLSTAFNLISHDPKLNIMIIAPKSREGSGTQASGAMLGCFGEISSAVMKHDISHEKFELAYQARKLWPQWIEQVNAYLPTRQQINVQQGTLIINNCQSGNLDDQSYQCMESYLHRYHEPYENVDANDIRYLNPIPTSRPTTACYLPNENFIDSSALLNALETALENSNQCIILDGVVNEILHDGEQVKGVTLESNETYYASTVLLAAGAYSQALIDKLHIQDSMPRLFYGLGNAIEIKTRTAPCPYVIRTINRSFACGLHTVPRSNGNVYVGATNNVITEPEQGPRIGLMQFLIRCAVEQINQDWHNANIKRNIVGHRPVTIDLCPLVGETVIDGLHIASGTYRDGVHLSPLIARYMTDKLVKGHDTIPELIKPVRRPHSFHSKHTAIEEGVENYMAGAYEHDMSLPRVGWDNMMRKLLSDKVKSIYEKYNTGYVFPPDFLLMFDENDEKHIRYLELALEQKHLTTG